MDGNRSDEVELDELLELHEIDENLMRNELHYIDRETLSSAGMNFSAYGKRATVGRLVNSADSAPLKTTSDIADEMGVSKRALYVEKQIAATSPEAQKQSKPPTCPRRTRSKSPGWNPRSRSKPLSKWRKTARHQQLRRKRMVHPGGVHQFGAGGYGKHRP